MDVDFFIVCKVEKWESYIDKEEQHFKGVVAGKRNPEYSKLAPHVFLLNLDYLVFNAKLN